MPRLIIAETQTSTWHYHLRAIEPGEEKYSGGAGPGLCGSKLGWDVQIPLKVYGTTASHIPERYCVVCRDLAIKKRIDGYEELQIVR